jgi:hypothetical protein
MLHCNIIERNYYYNRTESLYEPAKIMATLHRIPRNGQRGNSLEEMHHREVKIPRNNRRKHSLQYIGQYDFMDGNITVV